MKYFQQMYQINISLLKPKSTDYKVHLLTKCLLSVRGEIAIVMALVRENCTV